MNGVGTAIWNFLAAVQLWDFPTWVREGYIFNTFDTYYVLLAFHSLGMAVVVGVCFIISARLFGYGQAFPLTEARRLIPLGWYGFGLNLISGLILFAAQPRRELLTAVYDIKMIMIICACITMVILGKVMRGVDLRAAADGTVIEVMPPQARPLALFLTTFWLGAVATGRLIAFMQPPPL